MIRAVGSTARRIGSAGAARGSWVAVRGMATSGDLPPPAHEHSARIRPAEVGLGETAQHMFDIGGVFTNKPITMGPDATVYEVRLVFPLSSFIFGAVLVLLARTPGSVSLGSVSLQREGFTSGWRS
mmetsp:Transcript_830/g.3438  ORF Transcript_830/g.3438 Transcript_830/m.3438 type:complete len:126 (+) Transcript_830:82-459(+)